MEDAIYIRVLKFLSFRPRSEKEVRDYLKKKLEKFPDINNAIVDVIVHKLKQQKFLDDSEFAKMWVRSRTEFKPKGERLIRLELSQKGISKDIIDDAFASFDADRTVRNDQIRDEKALAIEILERKRKKYERMERQELFAKAGSMLARRGFDLEDIKAAIDSVFGKMV